MAVRAHQQTDQYRTAAPVRSATQSLISAALSMTATVAFIIALLASAVVAYGFMYRDQVYPGVQAVGVDIGGVSTAEAEAALDQRTAEYMSTNLTFESDGQTFSATPGELGVTFDTAQTVESAYEFGRSGNWWTDSREWFDALFFGRDVGVTPVVDSDQLQSYFQSIAADVGARPEEPIFQLTSDGQLQVTSAANGVGIDVQQTARDLEAELSNLEQGPVAISTVEVQPAYTEAALEPMGQRLSGIMSEDFILERGDYQWALDAQRLDALMHIEIDSETGESELSIDTERLEQQISRLAEDAQADGQDARVSWNGETYEVRPATDGWQIDVGEAVTVVEEAILAGEHRAALPVDEFPAAITTEVAEEAAEFGNEIAETRMQLTWKEGETDIGGSVIAAALGFEHDSEAGVIEPEVSVEDLTTFLSSISNDVNVKPVDANLRYVNGEVEVQSEEKTGWEMDREASAESIAEAVEAGESSAEIVVNEAEPEVTAAMAGEIEIREMISYGETYYGGSAPNRAHNVERATELANGALVPPGGTYSFVESIGGEISEDTGYVEGFGIEGATDGGVTTVPSIGGGVCQVSTTVFQAAFWAGMPVVERNWHVYWMPLYGQDPTGMTGLDATIATTAGLDFKFENTTGDWIAIVSSADGNANRFEIWGTDPGWEIETEGPNITNRQPASSETVIEETDMMPAGTRTQVETAHDGFDVEILRRVYDSEGEQIDDLALNSKYQPASNRVLVGTGN
ncbi:MAG: peptidoglycan binding domain-containing protein [Thermomicrobiaceae bacterium]